MRAVRVLWSFSRPHTVIGTFVSICTLYVIVRSRAQVAHWWLLASALVVGLCCNLFIVGINQLADVEIDRINKPGLPLPSGAMSQEQAWAIVFSCLAVCLGLSWYISPWLFGVVALATAIGWAYSMPPLHLKRDHMSAALAITVVRGLLINLGGFLVYDHIVNGVVRVPLEVWMLTAFILAFSISIAWFKDLPDVSGDTQHGIRTLPILYSPRTAVIAGHVLVTAAYLFTIVVLWVHEVGLADQRRVHLLLVGHLVLLALFMINASTFHADDVRAIRRFYVRFWWFFFAEYILYLVAYVFAG